jgi:hypothetical protein
MRVFGLGLHAPGRSVQTKTCVKPQARTFAFASASMSALPSVGGFIVWVCGWVCSWFVRSDVGDSNVVLVRCSLKDKEGLVLRV